jgi:hypothetical protein
VKLKIPSDCVVPLRRPPEDNVIPDGRLPETTDQVSESELDACNCCEYAKLASAFGNGEFVVIVSPVRTMIENACENIPPALSATCIVKLNVPVVVDTPEMIPVEERVRPGGSCPVVKDQEYAGTPPDTSMATEYAAPTEPIFRPVGLTIFRGFANATANACVAVCGGAAASETRTTKLNVPEIEGAPTSNPVEVRVTPPGRLPPATDHE